MYDANSVSILRVDNDSHYQDCRIDFDIHSQLELILRIILNKFVSKNHAKKYLT